MAEPEEGAWHATRERVDLSILCVVCLEIWDNRHWLASPLFLAGSKIDKEGLFGILSNVLHGLDDGPFFQRQTNALPVIVLKAIWTLVLFQEACRFFCRVTPYLLFGTPVKSLTPNTSKYTKS